MTDIYQKCLSWSRVYAEGEYTNASIQHIAAFANSVAYLVTGISAGYGGPSIREHAVSWALAGPDGKNVSGAVTVQYPDGSLPKPGKWEFEAACAFAAPLVFGPITDLHRTVAKVEYCFDDDPADIEAI